jgi:hypothetical protein
MDRLTFISNIVSAMAWPIAAVFIIFILKAPIVDLLRNIKRFRYKDAELDFKSAITELKEEEPRSGKQIALAENQLKLVKLSPRGAILEAWLELEETLACAAEKEGVARTRAGGVSGKPVPLDPSTFAKLLTESSRLSASSYDRFQKLREIRNKAVHLTDDVINQNDAEAFIRFVAEIKLEF